jgi:hypothetical protein
VYKLNLRVDFDMPIKLWHSQWMAQFIYFIRQDFGMIKESAWHFSEMLSYLNRLQLKSKGLLGRLMVLNLEQVMARFYGKLVKGKA